MNAIYTTQICKKCNQEKPLSEYHKRGVSHQRICKQCRKAHVPSGKMKVIVINTPDMYEPLMQRINDLKGKLRAKALGFANDMLEADDIYDVMVDEILFKSKPEDSDSRILTRAKWAAYAFIRRQRKYAMLIEDESSISGDDDEGFTEIISNPHQSAEEDFINRENMAEILEKIGRLPKEYQAIISLLSLGHNQREIANKLHKSDQAISATIKNIAAQLQILGLSPSFA